MLSKQSLTSHVISWAWSWRSSTIPRLLVLATYSMAVVGYQPRHLMFCSQSEDLYPKESTSANSTTVSKYGEGFLVIWNLGAMLGFCVGSTPNIAERERSSWK